MKADRRKKRCAVRGKGQHSVLFLCVSGFRFNSCDLALDFHHFFIIQTIRRRSVCFFDKIIDIQVKPCMACSQYKLKII